MTKLSREVKGSHDNNKVTVVWVLKHQYVVNKMLSLFLGGYNIYG
jgi:hypothetical protein